MTIESIMALQECMEFLGIEPDDFNLQTKRVRINVLSGGIGGGMVTVWLQNQPHRGPKLIADDTIRGFRIHYTSFEPEYQLFSFRVLDGDGQLTVSNSGSPRYSFVLSFSPNAQE